MTTLPKAKEAAREAEKIITMGKKGTSQARIHARDYLFVSLLYAHGNVRQREKVASFLAG